MKNHYLSTLTGLLIAGAVSAQPVITMQDLTPEIGTSSTMMTGIYSNPGDSGADQVWNLAGMFAQNGSEIEYLNPTGLPQSEVFPEATHAFHSEDESNTYSYFSYDNDQMTEIGYYSESPNVTVLTTFSDPRTHLIFPLNYTDSFNDTFASETINEIIVGQDTIVNTLLEVGFHEAEVDGYGTLTTPEATYEDVLRVKIESEVTYTVNTDGEEESSGERISTTYQFYKAGISTPLVTLQSTTLYNDGDIVNQSSSGSYFADPTVGMVESKKSFSPLKLYPMPAVSDFNLELNVHKASEASFSLLSTDGRLLHQWHDRALQTGNNHLYFPMPDLADGMYLFRVFGAEGTETRRIVVAKSSK